MSSGKLSANAALTYTTVIILSLYCGGVVKADDQCTVEFEEITVVKQVPTYKKHCSVIEDTKCKTVFKNAIETTMETQCEPVFETKCDPTVEIAYEQQCKMITDKECRIVHIEHMGEHQEKTICTDIPQEKCVPVPVKIPGEKCVNVPSQSCQNVPVTGPVEVPKQECWKKPRKVCQTLVTLKPKVVTEQIPKEVCEHSLPSEKHDFAHDFMNKNKPKSQESQFMEAFKPVQMGKQNPAPVVPQAMVAISPNSLIRPEPSKKPFGPRNQKPKATVISVKDVVKDAKNRRNIMAKKHKNNKNKATAQNQNAAMPPLPAMQVLTTSTNDQMINQGSNFYQYPSLSAPGNYAAYIQEVSNPQQLMSGPVQQMQQMWNYPQQQQQKQQQQQQKQQQQPMDNKYEPQQSIVNRFGKPNPKEQETEYDTMKEAHNAFLQSFPETDRFGVFSSQGTDRFGEFVSNDNDSFGQFEDTESDMFKRENPLGPRQRQNIEPRSYTKSAPKEVQNRVEKNSKVKSSRQLINSIPTIQSLDETPVYTDDLLGFYDGFEPDYYQQDYFNDQMRSRGEKRNQGNFFENVKSFASGLLRV